MAKGRTPELSEVSSSHIGAILYRIMGPLSHSVGTATTSRIDREDQQTQFFGTPEYAGIRPGEKQDEFKYRHRNACVEDDLWRRENRLATYRVNTAQLPSDLDHMSEYSDLTRKSGVTEITIYESEDSSELSPQPTTNYGRSDISLPLKTARERVATTQRVTWYGGSHLGLPLSAIPEDSFSTPRASAGIIMKRYIQSEENISKYAEKSEQEGGIKETGKVYTPILRKFENSDRSDDAMMEVEWRDETPYMTATKKGKKRNEEMVVKRPEKPKRPIPNMLQTPSRRKLEAD